EDASAASIDPTTSSGRATSCHAPPAQRLATGRVGPSSLSAPPNTQTLRLPDAATASSPSPPGWGRVSTTRHARPPSACPSARAVAVAGVTAITAADSAAVPTTARLFLIIGIRPFPRGVGEGPSVPDLHEMDARASPAEHRGDHCRTSRITGKPADPPPHRPGLPCLPRLTTGLSKRRTGPRVHGEHTHRQICHLDEGQSARARERGTVSAHKNGRARAISAEWPSPAPAALPAHANSTTHARRRRPVMGPISNVVVAG